MSRAECFLEIVIKPTFWEIISRAIKRRIKRTELRTLFFVIICITIKKPTCCLNRLVSWDYISSYWSKYMNPFLFYVSFYLIIPFWQIKLLLTNIFCLFSCINTQFFSLESNSKTRWVIKEQEKNQYRYLWIKSQVEIRLSHKYYANTQLNESDQPTKSYENPGCGSTNGSDERILFSYLSMN